MTRTACVDKEYNLKKKLNRFWFPVESWNCKNSVVRNGNDKNTIEVKPLLLAPVAKNRFCSRFEVDTTKKLFAKKD